MNDDDLINIFQFTPVFITLMKAMSRSEGHENGSLYGCKSPFTLSLEQADRDTGRRLAPLGGSLGFGRSFFSVGFATSVKPVLNWANVCSRT